MVSKRSFSRGMDTSFVGWNAKGGRGILREVLDHHLGGRPRRQGGMTRCVNTDLFGGLMRGATDGGGRRSIEGIANLQHAKPVEIAITCVDHADSVFGHVVDDG